MTSRSDSPFWRDRLPDGAQLVRIDRYTWAWAGPGDLAVGDRVVCEGSDWTGNRNYLGVVSGLGSDYAGPVRYLVRRAGPDEQIPHFEEAAGWI